MGDRTGFMVALAAGLAAAIFAFFSSAGADDQPETPAGAQASAVFAGGCFWCIESDFEKLEGVYEAVSGYTGGTIENPTYRNHSKAPEGGMAHYEAVKVMYDPDIVSYEELVDYFFRHIDPTDDGGQFCDRGDSYRTAIFPDTDARRETATTAIAGIEASGVLPAPVVTKILPLETFWTAEGYHQDYYKKNPVRYGVYRRNCGRDRTVARVWSGG